MAFQFDTSQNTSSQVNMMSMDLTGNVTGVLLPGPGHAAALHSKLNELSSSLDNLCKSVDSQLTEKLNDPAQPKLQSKQLLKRQLQSLKASLLNLGQKEHFLEVVKAFPEHHDFKPEADRAAAAVESAEEDLKDLKKINHQDEEQLRAAIASITGYHEQFKAVTARMGQKLGLSRKELEAYEASRPPPMSPLQGGPAEAEAQALLSAEGGRAVRLESAIVVAQGDLDDLAAVLDAELAEVAMLEEQVAAAQVAKADAVQEEVGRASVQLEWCREMTSVVATVTGVSLVAVEEDALRVKLRHFSPAVEGSDAPQLTVEFELTMYVYPGTSQLHDASLSPPAVDISTAIRAAKAQPTNSLQALLTHVRQMLRAHLGSA